MGQLFVGYAHANKAVAERLVAIIQEQTGRHVWWDRLLEPGRPWNAKIKKAIAECELFIVLLSQAALESPFVIAELGDARDLKKATLCVLLDNIPVVDLPHPLRVDQMVNLADWVPGQQSAELDKLLRVLDAQWRPALRRSAADAYQTGWRMAPLVLLTFSLMASGCTDLVGIDTGAGFVLLSARAMLGAGALQKDLVLVTIDDQTRAKLGDIGALRVQHAQALKKLHRASVVAYDIEFEPPEGGSPTAVGTREFADAITEVRGRGTSVVAVAALAKDGRFNLEPAILAALEPNSERNSKHVAGRGSVTNPCVGTQLWGLVATRTPLITKRGPDGLVYSFSLDAVLSHWQKDVSANWQENALALGSAAVKNERIRFTAYEPQLLASELSECAALMPGDEPVRYQLDALRADLRRGNAAVLPFEEILDPHFDEASVAHKLVVVGTQVQDVDRVHVWNHGIQRSFGVNVHLAAMNTLLSGAFIQRLGPTPQFAWLVAFTVLAAHIRTTTSLVSRASRRLWLLGLLVLDLGITLLCTQRGILPDWPYHLLAIGLGYGLAVRMGRANLIVESTLRNLFRSKREQRVTR